MKRLSLMLIAMTIVASANAQFYNVGTSSTSTDYLGNQTTVHRDQYGLKIVELLFSI